MCIRDRALRACTKITMTNQEGSLFVSFVRSRQRLRGAYPSVGKPPRPSGLHEDNDDGGSARGWRRRPGCVLEMDAVSFVLAERFEDVGVRHQRVRDLERE